MSADGELYIDEQCRDMFMDILNKTFGEEKWKFNVIPFMGIYNMAEFPTIVEVDIVT